MEVSVATRNASIDASNALINGGTLEIRTGTPAAIGSTPTGTVLGTFTIAATAFGSAAAGSSTANAIADATASATGTAGHYVAKDSGGNPERAGVVGTELTINNTSITSGDTLSLTSWTFAQPAGSN
jgi:hypothetical protein